MSVEWLFDGSRVVTFVEFHRVSCRLEKVNYYSPSDRLRWSISHSRRATTRSVRSCSSSRTSSCTRCANHLAKAGSQGSFLDTVAGCGVRGDGRTEWGGSVVDFSGSARGGVWGWGSSTRSVSTGSSSNGTGGRSVLCVEGRVIGALRVTAVRPATTAGPQAG